MKTGQEDAGDEKACGGIEEMMFFARKVDICGGG